MSIYSKERKGISHPRPNHNSVPEYQLSGIPFVTSSNIDECDSETSASHIRFPAVTRWFIVSAKSTNANATLKFGFSENGVTSLSTGSMNRFFTVKEGEQTQRLELRCKELFFAMSGSSAVGFEVIAGLTGCVSGEFPTLTGSVKTVLNPLMSGVG